MNPARSFGPAVVMKRFSPAHWVSLGLPLVPGNEGLNTQLWQPRANWTFWMLWPQNLGVDPESSSWREKGTQ